MQGESYIHASGFGYDANNVAPIWHEVTHFFNNEYVIRNGVFNKNEVYNAIEKSKKRVMSGVTEGEIYCSDVTVSSNKAYSKTIKNLTGGKYYVRVRTYKTVGKTKYYSAWSSSKYTTAKKK